MQKEALRKVEISLPRTSTIKHETSPRFADFAYEEFSIWCANEHKDRPSTYARYMRSVKALAELFGDKRLEMIDAGWVERYKVHRSLQRRKNARDGRLVSPAAVNRDLAVLRILFNFAIRLGKVNHNPVREIKFLKEPSRFLRVLTPEEEQH
ncbi:MAG: phage integrase SAM-like domain-containing protein, partial [Acidobacteria bacterium]|nr:phage integrase SAM-like domain-containing protein [Acidobacteriota bacterium]